MTPDVAPERDPAPRTSLVGRGAEARQLRAALSEAKAGRGSAWIVRGPPGIGKSHLLRWLRERALEEGFDARLTSGKEDRHRPGGAFEAALRSAGAAPPSGTSSEPTAPLSLRALADLPSIVLLEEDRPRRLFELLRRYALEVPSLLVSRDRAAIVRQREPSFPSDLAMIWLTRAEGEGALSPTEVDALGERVHKHFQAHPGSVVAMTGMEYLVSQNAFLPVLRLIQFLRDSAESTGGHLLLSLPPAAFDSRQLSLLESEGEVSRAAPAPAPSPTGATAAAPTASTAAGPIEGLSRRGRRVEEELRRRATSRPLCLLVDDLEEADGISRPAFDHLGRDLGATPLLLVGAWRDDDTGASEGRMHAHARPSASSDRPLAELRLAPLAEGEARELLGTLSAAAPRPEPDDAWSMFLRGAGANPGLLTLVARQRLPRPTAAGPGAPLHLPTELPTSLRGAVEETLRTLGPRARAIGGAAALLGTAFEPSILADALGTSPAEVERELHALVRGALVEPAPEGEIAWRFTHDGVREAVLAALPASERASSARGLAREWERRRPEDLATLARLFFEGGEAVEGLPWVRRAFEQAVRAYGITEARTELGRWISWGREREEEMGALVEAVLDASWEFRCFGDVDGAWGLVEEAREHARTDLQRAQLEVELADLREGHPGGEARLTTAASAVAGLSDRAPGTLRARLALVEGRVALSQGAYGSAGGFLERWTNEVLPASPRDELLGLRLRLALAEADLHNGRFSDAVRIFEEVRSAGYDRAAGRLGPSCRLLHAQLWELEADLYLGRGDLPRARALSEEALRLLKETGSPAEVAQALLRVGAILREQGLPAEAASRLDEAKGLARAFALAPTTSLAELELGLLQAQRQEWVAARATLEPARRTLPPRYHRTLAPLAELFEALCEMEEGRHAPAATKLKSLEPQLRQLGPRWLPTYHRHVARLREREGLAAAAHQEIERGLAEARASSNRLAEGQLLGDLARWEQRHGERLRAQETERRSRTLLRACGVERDPWALPPIAG